MCGVPVGCTDCWPAVSEQASSHLFDKALCLGDMKQISIGREHKQSMQSAFVDIAPVQAAYIVDHSVISANYKYVRISHHSAGS